MSPRTEKTWYEIDDIDSIDSPALVIYRQRLLENIHTLVSMANDVTRLRPHVKTHKTKEIAALMIRAGITKFKCATIAEAEMLALANAHDVLIAYQLPKPKQKRFIHLIKKYPATKFSCLVDNGNSAKELSHEAIANKITIPVYLDINVGMNRTGIIPGDIAVDLYKQCKNMSGINAIGLHVYDGHIRNMDINERTIACDKAFEPVLQMRDKLKQEDRFDTPIIVAGGSPTFPVHIKKRERECSPGTFIFWDYNYQTNCEEQNFLPAALVIARVISIPAKNKICIDLGHKSIAAENEISKRVYFLNVPELKFISQSEEHLVAEVPSINNYKVGDVLYGLPYHICPTVALYERALVIDSHQLKGEWKIIARDRKINV